MTRTNSNLVNCFLLHRGVIVLFCSNCGNQLQAGSSFCGSCGAKVGVNVEATQYAPNPGFEKAKQFSNNYFSEFAAHIKAPLRHGLAVDKSKWLFGLINLCVFIFCFGLSNFRGVSVDFWGFTSFNFGIAFLSMFVSWIVMALILAGVIGLIWLMAKWMRNDVNFIDVLSRFGAMMLIPALFMIGYFFFGLFLIGNPFMLAFVGFFVAIFSTGFFLSWLLAITLTIYSYGKDKAAGIDAYYTILLTFLGLLLAFSIFGAIMGGLVRFNTMMLF